MQQFRRRPGVCTLLTLIGCLSVLLVVSNVSRFYLLLFGRAVLFQWEEQWLWVHIQYCKWKTKQNKFKESLKITKSGPRWSVSLGVWSLGTQWTCWVLQQMFLLQGDCEWSRHRKQGVYFFGSPWEISGDGRAAVSYSFTFEPSLGDIRMDFSVTSQWRRAITDWTAHFLPNLTFNMFCSDWISMINHNSECGTWEA